VYFLNAGHLNEWDPDLFVMSTSSMQVECSETNRSSVCLLLWQPLDQKQLHALLERFLKKDLVNAPLATKTGLIDGEPMPILS
jgi:hypothetical protein